MPSWLACGLQLPGPMLNNGDTREASPAPLAWAEYAAEAAGLAFFMINAGILATVLDHPESPVHKAIPNALLRRIPLGIIMGMVIISIVYSPWGKRSGAHLNPAVTWMFYRLRKISFRDAVLYTVAQFLGGMAAAHTLKAALGAPFAHSAVKYATTRPGEAGTFAAFAAELFITFILMLTVLLFLSSERRERFTGVASGVLIMLYLFFETPLSGMSLNPARTFGSALAGGVWDGIWLYFVAPPAGALLAAEVFLKIRKDSKSCAKLSHSSNVACIFCDYQHQKPLPHVPLAESH